MMVTLEDVHLWVYLENRTQLLNPLINYIGIGIVEHNKYKFVVSVILASRVETKKNNIHIANLHNSDIK